MDAHASATNPVTSDLRPASDAKVQPCRRKPGIDAVSERG